MINKGNLIFLLILLIICLLSSGCALIGIPVQVTKGAFGLVGYVLKETFTFIGKLPKPPLGVFLDIFLYSF